VTRQTAGGRPGRAGRAARTGTWRTGRPGAPTGRARGPGARRGVRTRALTAVAGLLLGGGLAACGGEESGPPTLTWYQNPDNGGQAKIAQECADASNGAYQVEMQVLPSSATDQREQLVRRLAAKDSSIDVMSLDVIYTAEFANAGFLREFTPEETQELSAGRLEAPLETAKWKDKLYASPIKSNAQLLWYRKSAAQAAGVDPSKETFTWDEMLKAAESQGKKISEQGARYEGYMVWVNALVASAGGAIVKNVEAGADAEPDLASPAGQKAAKIIGDIARSSAASPDLPNAQEEQARATFQSDAGMFMLNWPYILAAARTAVEDGSLEQSVVDDIAWARYPRVDANTPSKPPLGGANLAVGAFTKYPQQAADLVKCATSLEKSTGYMLAEGEPSPFIASYDNPEVRKAYPNADLIRTSINEGGPRPITPYYVDVAGSVINTWHPPSSVTTDTASSTDTFMTEILRGERLL
jgi:multiple sugar transport system substrate-binding protein